MGSFSHGRGALERASGFTLATAFLATSCSKPAQPGDEPVRVAAAADLSFAFEEIGMAYERATGTKVVFSFGSTGLLEKQIAEGAPFDVFAAADVSYADEAVRAGACLPDSRSLYATGRVVLFPGKGQAFVPRVMADLRDARVTKIAIANADHAPYGRAAKQAMERAGVWSDVRSKVVFGDNVHQALDFVQTGNADVGIVALSLALAIPGDWTLIPGELHDPIDQALVVCARGKAGPAAGRRFAAYIESVDARAVLHKYGFVVPDESIPAAKRGNTGR
jgi:molybdate transport system substrate-binding protein